MKRVLAMEKQSLTDNSVTGVGGVSFYPYQQETFPYWVNRLVDTPQEIAGIGEDEYDYRVNIEALLVVAHLTSDYKGDKHDLIYDYIVYVLNYFNDNRELTSDDYEDAPKYLNPLDLETVNSFGVGVFTNAGISAQQLGARFRFTIQYRISRPF